MKPEILGNIKFGPYVALMKVHQPLIDGLLKRAEKKERRRVAVREWQGA